MNRTRLIASTPSPDDTSPGGILATAMRYLAGAAPTATGITCISPDGTVRYISRQEAERFVFGPDAGEVRQ
jgi:hypothetical protein